MSNNTVALLAALASAVGIPFENLGVAAKGASASAGQFHVPQGFGRGNKTKNCTGRTVTQRQLRKRWEEQGGNAGNGRYVMIAGRIRNMKKLTGRC